MKDSYTLDIDAPGLDKGFDKHYAAYKRIFARIGLDAVDVQASSGAMGGTVSTEFMVPSEAGEDWIVTCDTCDYRANVEKATSELATVDDGEAADLERFPTPGLRTIAALAEAHPDVANPERQIKTLVYSIDGELILVLIRGDHDLQEQKLIDATAAAELRPGTAEEIRDLLGADPGSLGAVSVENVRIIADPALEGRVNMTTGANEDDWHYQGVSVSRDIGVTQWADLRTVHSGEKCAIDGGTLDLWKGIEIGHIFKLGTEFSEVFGAYVQDEDGNSHPIIMGSYGIGLERNMAAVVETSHDDHGIVWPVSVAPYEVVVTVIRPDDEDTMAVANRLYDEFDSAGVEALLDDRDERPGVKFADSELIGIPYRVVVGPKGVQSGIAEITKRDGMVKSELALGDVVSTISSEVLTARFGI
jgi:prolyl-tRNA synthetase